MIIRYVNEAVAAYPIWNSRSPFMKMKKLDVSVDVPGPPLVKTKTVSIILEASISLIIIAPIDMGAIRGKVTYINFLNGEAPSTAAAKKGSLGKLKSPANINRNINDVHCQTSTTIMETFAKPGLDNHGGCTPKILRKSFKGPKDS